MRDYQNRINREARKTGQKVTWMKMKVTKANAEVDRLIDMDNYTVEKL